MDQVPLGELKERMKRFKSNMDNFFPDWEMAVIFSKINIYYFTGTIAEGMLLIPRDEEACLWVRRSFPRSIEESLFPNIKAMNSYRDAEGVYELPETVYLETEKITIAFYDRFHKYFPFQKLASVDNIIAKTRAVKSEYEVLLMTRAGEIHQKVLEEDVPDIVWEGMNETDLAGKLFTLLLERGHHGVTRFNMFDSEMILGLVGFGDSSIHPSVFNSPGGSYGICPAVPLFGNRKRKLVKGDLIFVDVGFGIDGYNTDKTMNYMFGHPLPSSVIDIHHKCVEIQEEAAKMLKPGAIPSEIYDTVINSLDDSFLKNFMGYGSNQVKFLGHGIGLHIDELPVIARGFNEPLKENMVIALEPKKGIKNVGLVGTENTYLVTSKGGKSLTGDNPGLIPIY